MIVSSEPSTTVKEGCYIPLVQDKGQQEREKREKQREKEGVVVVVQDGEKEEKGKEK